ncbi:PAS domain-containing sensor histidine kinase [Natronococcus occultus]|uniref:histidine kinase n=1 Tax=Natronococcus occultus SP4 TaxID=694430 RepID=L0K250_9EURY|nr:ATP-binding protein [Natronococcus occultus]AGB39081.1 PAS domain S-box [Natronococcus occultus SP4]
MDAGSPDEPADDAAPTRSAGSRLSLLETASVPSVQLTSAGRIGDATAAFASLTGYERSKLLGRRFAELLAGEVPALDVLEAGNRRTPLSTTCSLRTGAETVVDADLHLDPPDDNDPERRVTAIVDPKPSLARSSATQPELTYGRTFEALADAVPDGIIVLDSDSEIRYANPAVERILGHDPAELVGGSKVEIIPPRLRQTHLDALQRYLETGERNLNWTYVELPGQHSDGYEIPLGISLNDFVHDGDRYFVGLFRDISPRKEAEEMLTTKVAQLESVAYLSRYALENADDDELFRKASELVTAAFDAEYCAVLETETTDSGDERTAFRTRAAVGCEDAFLESEPVSTAESLAAAACADGEPVVVEDVAADDRFDASSLLPDGEYHSGLAVAVGPAADAWGVLAVYDDRAREFGDHDVDFLDSVATILATALERRRYERRLNEAVRDLEASNERLEQFAYAASHDLQEPLRMVSSYLELLEDRYGDRLDEDAEEFLAYAVDGAERMREMIDGLLAYSRIDSQGDPFEPVALEDVLDDVLTDLQVMIERHDAEITTEPLPTIQGDSSQLRQLFQNLLSNAIEYSGDEPPRIHVSAERDGDRWRLSVRDEGIGLDPEAADRIFQVFQRLHGTDEYDGTGIGLAICRRIVERHGGEIRVDSEPGDGATFTFTLPATEP